MRTITINYNTGAVSDYDLGHIGEHKETTLVITPPDSLTQDERTAFYLITIRGKSSVWASEMMTGPALTLELCQDLTQDRRVSIQVTAYDTDGDFVGKSDVLGGFYFEESHTGEPIVSDGSTPDLMHQVYDAYLQVEGAVQGVDAAVAAANAAASYANTEAANAHTQAAAAKFAADDACDMGDYANVMGARAERATQTANTAAAAADTAREAIQGDLAAMDARIDTLEGTIPTVDATLTTAGDAADAKAAGDRLGALEASDAETDKLKTGAVGIIPIPIATAADLTDGSTIKHADGTTGSGGGYYGDTDYIDIDGITELAYMRPEPAVSSAPTHGMAFYDASKVYISGVPNGYGASQSYSALYRTLVPTGAKYARFTYWASTTANYSKYPFAVYDATAYDDAAATNGKFSDIIPVSLYTGGFQSGYIRYSNGVKYNSSASVYTDYLDIGDCTKITYTRIKNSTTSIYTGMAFYDEDKVYISGEAARTRAEKYGYELHTVAVPDGAKYARFSWGSTFGTDNFAVYNTETYTATMQSQIDRLYSSRPGYTGLKASILGDSISTFVLASEKVDIDGRKYAPEGCVTNYPGNLLQYANSDVQDVDATWWSMVLEQTGMTLGVNESFAGSMISWDGTTENYKYGADKCMASTARIGHLDDNGTPDVIFIFGGTNDINHHAELNIPLGTLDTTHDPSDFANFPMVTNTIYGAITTMLLRVQHTYPNAQILCILPYYCTANHSDTHPSDVAQFNGAMINVCDYLGVDYVDMRNIVNVYDLSTLLFDDLHPNAAGMLAIANEVIAKLYTAKSTSGGGIPPTGGGAIQPATADTLGGVKVDSSNSVKFDSANKLTVNTPALDANHISSLVVASMFTFGTNIDVLIDDGSSSYEELHNIFIGYNEHILDGIKTGVIFVPARSDTAWVYEDENYEEQTRIIVSGLLYLMKMTQDNTISFEPMVGDDLRSLIVNGIS